MGTELPGGRDVAESILRAGPAAASTPLHCPFRDHARRAMIRKNCVDGLLLMIFGGCVGADRRRAGRPRERTATYHPGRGQLACASAIPAVVVTKGAPANLVRLLRRRRPQDSPTRFEIRKRNWRPDRDLRILIVQSRPRGE